MTAMTRRWPRASLWLAPLMAFGIMASSASCEPACEDPDFRRSSAIGDSRIIDIEQH